MVAVPHPRLRPYTSPLFISLPPQRRQTEVSNLRALIDKRITDAKNESASELSTLSADVRAALEGISETVSKLTQAVSAETEARKSEGQILARAVLDRVEKLGNKVEDERASRLEAEARVTRVPGGALVLEVTGQLRNTGRAAMSVGALKATLGGGAVGGGTSVARRWTIALPVRRLEAGASVDFSSTLTDVPGGATRLRITTS